MDPLTHTLLGASLSYAVFGRRLGRTAALVGAVAALAPDADVFIRSAEDPLIAIEHHRGFTHALLFAPLGAALAALPWRWSKTWRLRWAEVWHCAVVAYLSHVLLDAATTYGTQLLWPLSRHRFGWDLISIIDPVFTLSLALGLGVALWRQRTWAVRAGLAAAALYLTLGLVQQTRATSAARELARTRGHQAERLNVMPTMANQLVWRSLYVHQGRAYSDRVRVGWFSRAQVRTGWALPLVPAEHLTAEERARNERDSYARFAWFSDQWVVRAPDDPSVLGDARYTFSTDRFEPIWGIRFLPPGSSSEVQWVNRSGDRRVEARELWEEIRGRGPGYAPLAAR